MTGRTAGLPNVPSVVEHRVETSQRRKRFYARRRVTYRAERARVIGKLLDMTRCTGRVPGTSRRKQADLAFVTDEARQTCVLRF